MESPLKKKTGSNPITLILNIPEMVPIIWNFPTSTMVAKEVSNIRGKRFNHQGWTWPLHAIATITK
jgi:hypothetical protein